MNSIMEDMVVVVTLSIMVVLTTTIHIMMNVIVHMKGNTIMNIQLPAMVCHQCHPLIIIIILLVLYIQLKIIWWVLNTHKCVSVRSYCSYKTMIKNQKQNKNIEGQKHRFTLGNTNRNHYFFIIL